MSPCYIRWQGVALFLFEHFDYSVLLGGFLDFGLRLAEDAG